jgi:hypothetical protein
MTQSRTPVKPKSKCAKENERAKNIRGCRDITTNHKISLAVLVGVTIGIAGANAVHAHQVEAPAAYLISEADAIIIAGLQKCGEKLPETLAPVRGRNHSLVRGVVVPVRLVSSRWR